MTVEAYAVAFARAGGNFPTLAPTPLPTPPPSPSPTLGACSFEFIACGGGEVLTPTAIALPLSPAGCQYFAFFLALWHVVWTRLDDSVQSGV